jgi:1-acyl-sn-glycerol-3-phosphate acyltransferase
MNPPSIHPSQRASSRVPPLWMDARTAAKPTFLERAVERLENWLRDHLPEQVKTHLAAIADEQNEFGFDPFGFNPEFVPWAYPLLVAMHRYYFRTQVYGIEQVPASGRVLLIANHSGQLPIDGMLIGSSMLLDRDPPRIIRTMVERWAMTLPFVSYVFPRLGQMIGTRENCRAMLEREQAILVFPEGVRGSNKVFQKRYQLQAFGYGFMRLALETNTPIVPVGVVGGEEQIISLYNAEKLGRLFGMPALPIGPGAIFGPLGMVTPLPVKYHLHFGAPMTFSGSPDDEDRVIHGHVEDVKAEINRLIQHGLATRKGIFT